MNDDLIPDPYGTDLQNRIETRRTESPLAIYLGKRKTKQGLRSLKVNLLSAARHLIDGLDEYIRYLESNGCNPYDVLYLIDWHHLDFARMNKVKASLSAAYVLNYANQCLTVVRRLLEESWEMGWMTYEQFEPLRTIKMKMTAHKPAGREVTDEEIEKLWRYWETRGITGIRDMTVLGLLRTCGLWPWEIAAIQRADYEPENGQLFIRDREKSIKLYNQTRVLMDIWTELRGDEPGALFTRVYRGPYNTYGSIQQNLEGVSSRSLYMDFKKCAQAAGVKRFRLMDLRRSFLAELSVATDILTMARISGLSVQTCQRYDLRAREAYKKAVETLGPDMNQEIVTDR